MKSWLFPTHFKNVARSFTLALSLCYISFILSLPFFSNCDTHTHSQAGRKSTHTFSLNTLNLNSLLIRRYVTSLTLPSSPSLSPPSLCLASCVHPSLQSLPSCFLPSQFIFTHSSSLYLFFLSPSIPLGACPFRGTCEHSTAPLKTASNLKVN